MSPPPSGYMTPPLSGSGKKARSVPLPKDPPPVAHETPQPKLERGKVRAAVARMLRTEKLPKHTVPWDYLKPGSKRAVIARDCTSLLNKFVDAIVPSFVERLTKTVRRDNDKARPTHSPNLMLPLPQAPHLTVGIR